MDRADHEAALLELITSGWKSQAVRAAVELGIPDLLGTGAMTSTELAAAAGAHPPSLRRLLRALSTLDLVVEGEDGRFEATPMGALMPSLRSWSIWWGEFAWPEWARLVDSVRTGRSARALVGGAAAGVAPGGDGSGFGALGQDARRAEVFHSAMAELSALEVRELIGAYDFSSFGWIVDVGGGYGETLVAILAAYPDAKGVVFDLAHCAAGGRHSVDGAGLSARCEVVTGDFFAGVPAGADAYVLKSVLHDWADPEALRILQVCRAAMVGESKLVLIERLMPDRLTASVPHRSLARTDLQMLLAHGARERTEGELAALLERAGLGLRAVVALASGLGILEAAPE